MIKKYLFIPLVVLISLCGGEGDNAAVIGLGVIGADVLAVWGDTVELTTWLNWPCTSDNTPESVTSRVFSSFGTVVGTDWHFFKLLNLLKKDKSGEFY